MKNKDIITAIIILSGIVFCVGIITGMILVDSIMNNDLEIIDDLATQYIDNYSKLRDLTMPFKENDTVTIEWGGYRSSQWFQEEDGTFVLPIVSSGWTFWVNHTQPYTFYYPGYRMFVDYTSFYLLVDDKIRVLN